MDSRKYIKKLIISEVVIIMMFSALLFSCGEKVESGKTQMVQYPSPMVENTRAHQRIEKKDIPGFTYILNSILSKPVEVYYTDSLVKTGEDVDLIIHFHGASYIPEYAAYNSEHSFIVAIVNLGSGSSVYENEFLDNSNFTNLVKSLSDTVASKGKIKISKIYLSSFSAGYGAVRAILNQNFSIVHGIILLDGLHTDYIPERKTLAAGGKLNSIKLQDFLKFAEYAVEGKKRFLITHSEIFPGTYASTTETADWLIAELNLSKLPTLKWGPVGMQQLSELSLNGLTILGFAGNSAPDHVDHYHGLPEFIKIFLSGTNL